MQPFSGNQRPDLLTSLMNMSLVLRLPREMHLCRSSSNIPRLPSFSEMPQSLHILLTFGKVQNPLRLPCKTISEPAKVVRACGVFSVLTWKCASRHNSVHVFDISTSKSVPSMVSGMHFLTSQLPKVLRTRQFFTLLISKCASRHNGVRFFDLSTSLKRSEAEVFCTC